MVICMDSKSFLEQFAPNEEPKVILEATYLVASNRIRIGQKYKDQVEIMFMPNERTIIAMNDEESIKADSNSEYVKRYFKELDDDIRYLALIIKLSLLKNQLVIILTTNREWKSYGHIPLLQAYVKDKFRYEFKTYKSGMNLFEQPKNKTDIIELCEKLIKKDKKKEKQMLMKTEIGQKDYFGRMNKKELKKYLKKEGLYRPGMNEEEMVDTIISFLV